MNVFIVSGLFWIIVGIGVVGFNNPSPIHLLGYLVGILGAILMVVGIVQKFDEMEPTAMDVYQGKTALQYTYVDSVKVDSVVVFKEEWK